MLGGLRLLLSVDDGHVRDVDLHEVVAAGAAPQLSQGLDKGHALHVADGAAKLDDAHVRLLARVVDGYAGNLLHPFLDGVGDVGDDLHRLAQVVALALALDDVLVDLAGGDVVVAGEGDVEVALVVAEIEVDFAAVGEDKDFAVPARCSVCRSRPRVRGSAYSLGFIVPASTLRYGSILIEDTCAGRQ